MHRATWRRIYIEHMPNMWPTFLNWWMFEVVECFKLTLRALRLNWVVRHLEHPWSLSCIAEHNSSSWSRSKLLVWCVCCRARIIMSLIAVHFFTCAISYMREQAPTFGLLVSLWATSICMKSFRWEPTTRSIHTSLQFWNETFNSQCLKIL